MSIVFFFFNDTATTEIYTLSLHDALPISQLDVGDVLQVGLVVVAAHGEHAERQGGGRVEGQRHRRQRVDRKSTRLNSSHLVISYAVFCLKKKKKACSACTWLCDHPHVSLG